MEKTGQEGRTFPGPKQRKGRHRGRRYLSLLLAVLLAMSTWTAQAAGNSGADAACGNRAEQQSGTAGNADSEGTAAERNRIEEAGAQMAEGEDQGDSDESENTGDQGTGTPEDQTGMSGRTSEGISGNDAEKSAEENPGEVSGETEGTDSGRTPGEAAEEGSGDTSAEDPEGTKGTNPEETAASGDSLSGTPGETEESEPGEIPGEDPTEISEEAGTEELLISLQEQIDSLPSPEDYDYLSLSGKEEAAGTAAELKQEYYDELTEEEREQIDPANLFALDLYAQTYAYDQTEDEYSGQLTCEDVDTVRLSSGELKELQSGINELPDLAEVTDVSSLGSAEATDGTSETSELTGDSAETETDGTAEIPEFTEGYTAAEESVSESTDDTEEDDDEDPARPAGDEAAESGSLAYTDPDTEVYLSPSGMDSLYEDVYDLADDYYSLPASQASQVNEIGLANLTAFFTVGVSLYASVKSAEVGTIDGFSYQRYSGNLADSEMHFGYYTVNTKKSDGTRLAFCMDSKLYSPGRAGTTLVSETSYTDKVIRTILYYGYGGPGERVKHDLNGYCETHMAICYAVDGKAINTAFGKAAYKKLYTDVSDKTVYKYVKAAVVKGQISGRQPLVYAIFTGDGRMKKVSSTDSSKVIAGAGYTVYTDSKCKNEAYDVDGKKCVFTTTDSGSNIISLEPGTYYVKETKAPDGYAVSTTVQKMTVQAGKTTTLTVKDAPLGQVRAAKKGRQSGKFLAGAVYRVYKDAKCKKLLPDVNGKYELTTITESPYSNILTYPVGTVIYVKEYKAPKGMKLDSMVYSSTVEESVTNWANGAKKRGGSFLDDEISKVRIRLQKSAWDESSESVGEEEPADGASGDAEPSDEEKAEDETEADSTGTSSVSFEGAVFAMEYRNNEKGDESGAPDAVWYFRTDERGIIDFADRDYLVEKYTFANTQGMTEYSGQTIRSDAVNEDDDGSLLWSAGTYRVKEICAPSGCQLDGVMTVSGDGEADDGTVSADLAAAGEYDSAAEGVQLIIAWDSSKGEFICRAGKTGLDAGDIRIYAWDRLYQNSLHVTKYGEDRIPLEGVTYQLTRADDGTVCGTVTTDKAGKGSFTDLPEGDYILTETKTVDGYALMEESVTIHLPCRMTKKEVSENKADLSKAYFDEVTQTYCFRDVNYEITDSPGFPMPMTGGSVRNLVTTAMAGVLLILGGLVFFRRRRR